MICLFLQLMKKVFNISFVLIISVSMYLAYADNYFSKQHPLFAGYDIENQQSSADNTSQQNILSIEEEDNHKDNFSNSQINFCLRTFYYQKYYITNYYTPLAFPALVWQPPRQL